MSPKKPKIEKIDGATVEGDQAAQDKAHDEATRRARAAVAAAGGGRSRLAGLLTGGAAGAPQGRRPSLLGG